MLRGDVAVPVLRTDEERIALAAAVRADVDPPGRFPSPFLYVWRLGFSARPAAADDPDALVFDGRSLVYRWNEDQRERGLATWAGLAAAVAADCCAECSPSDVGLLALEMACPSPWLESVDMDALILVCRWLPVPVLTEWVLRGLRTG